MRAFDSINPSILRRVSFAVAFTYPYASLSCAGHSKPFSYTTRAFADGYTNSPTLEDYIGRWLDGHIDILVVGEEGWIIARSLLRFADLVGF
jgi:hypothetical protein